MFYVTCLDQMPNVTLDQSEVVTLRWTTPLAILEEYSAGSVFLAPPQVYEMSRLATMNSFNNLSKLARERESLGVERWMPVVGAANDGVVALLPGRFLIDLGCTLLNGIKNHESSIIEIAFQAMICTPLSQIFTETDRDPSIRSPSKRFENAAST